MDQPQGSPTITEYRVRGEKNQLPLRFQLVTCEKVERICQSFFTWFCLVAPTGLAYLSFSTSLTGSQGILCKEFRPNGSAPIFGLQLCDTQDVIRTEMTAHSSHPTSVKLLGVTHS